MQNMETYFGFKVFISKDLDPADEEILQAQAKRWVDEEKIDLEKYNVYFHQLIISAKEEHFGVGDGLVGRVEGLNIEFHVNLKQRRSQRIQFRNHVIDTSVPHLVKPYFNPDYIGYEIQADYFSDSNWFQNAIIALVDKDLRRDHRKIKVQVTAQPTARFRSVLNDISKADLATHLDLRFEKEVQLRMPFPYDPKKLGEPQPKDVKVVNYINNGVANAFGENAQAGDLVIDKNLINQLGQLAAHARQEGNEDVAKEIEAAIDNASEEKNINFVGHLRRVGIWGLKAAEKLGMGAAEEAIKAAIG